MDKAEFVRRSPIYYALAIAIELKKRPALSEYSIKGQYPDVTDDHGETGSLLGQWLIWERAIAWLLARDMIKLKVDPFGPPIISKTPAFDDQWEQLTNDQDLPFSSYRDADHSEDWLLAALHAVENTFVNLEMKPEDFENPDAVWTPIQIDPAEPTVVNAVISLERIIEEVRSDNGYNVTLPQERDFVLDGLAGTLERIKSSNISAGYVRMAMDRLRILGQRFAGTVKEATIAGAKVALIEFAKKHFGDALNYVWRFFF